VQVATKAAAQDFGRPSVQALTGVRFVAAAVVVFYHAALFWRKGLVSEPSPTGLLPGLSEILYAVLDSGFAMVGLFFVLSGFVLAYNYLPTNTGTRGGAWNFWVARLARVYPMYLIAFLLAALPFWWTYRLPNLWFVSKSAAYAITLTQAWHPSYALRWNGPAWSLSNEAFFYATFPLFGAILTRFKSTQLIALSFILWIVGSSVPLCAFSAWQAGFLPAPQYGEGWLTVVLCNPLLRLPDFLIGVAVGKIFVLRQSAKPWPMPPWFALLAALLAVLVAARLPTSLGQTTPLAVVWAVLLYSLASAPQSASARLLGGRPMVLLGEASYAMYLLHLPIWFLAAHYFPVPGPEEPHLCWLYIILYFFATVGISILAHRLFEEPARRLVRSVLVR
jgi:peptidoglycan/LPS O-acetylase OafA/YrhL